MGLREDWKWPAGNRPQRDRRRGTMTDAEKIAKEAIGLTLDFHSSPWDDEKRRRWLECTGSEVANTRVLYDHLRELHRLLFESEDPTDAEGGEL